MEQNDANIRKLYKNKTPDYVFINGIKIFRFISYKKEQKKYFVVIKYHDDMNHRAVSLFLNGKHNNNDLGLSWNQNKKLGSRHACSMSTAHLTYGHSLEKYAEDKEGYDFPKQLIESDRGSLFFMDDVLLELKDKI